MSDTNWPLPIRNTILTSRKTKYVGKPMSVLIQDLDFYQVPIEDFIYQWNRGREVGVYNSY
ncbi:MAG: hypothetical protein PF436_07720, partial [Prolixibacteraceae bacterium]|nr:hypothetical protein [Prolixibacteraceae bacterium]